MSHKDEIIRLKTIKNKIDTIYLIVERHGNIVKALGDIEGQPAILMLLVAISEQFSKLFQKKSPILDYFDKGDIGGIISVRNYIAHDYDGVNLTIIEDDLHENMPRVLNIVNKILENENSFSG
jgi:uncharacterized protein with HEPN domain